MEFSLDLMTRLRNSLQRNGYCFLSYDEIQRVLVDVPADRRFRQEALERFAQICGAEVEINEHFKSARFVPRAMGAKNSSPDAEELRPAAFA